MGVVPRLDEPEEGHPRLGLGLELDAVEEGTLERGREGYGHRIFMAVANRAHPRMHSGRLTALSEGDGGRDRPGRRGE